MNEPIQSLWLGPLTNLERLSICSFLAHGHPVHLYAYDHIDVLRGVTLFDANDILPLHGTVFGHIDVKAEYPQSPRCFSNLFRHYLMLAKGGYWADLDVVCLRPWDFAEPYVFAEETGSILTVLKPRDEAPLKGKVAIASEAFRVPAGADITRRAIAQIEKTDVRLVKPGDLPFILTRLVYQMGFPIKPVGTFCPIPLEQLPKTLIDHAFDFRQAYAIHFWNNAWASSRFNKNASYAPNSLFEQLKRQYLH